MLELLLGTALVASPLALMLHDRLALAAARGYLALRHRDTQRNIAQLERQLGIDDETLLREAARITALATVERERKRSLALLDQRADALRGPTRDWRRQGDGFLVGPERLNFAPATAASAGSATLMQLKNLAQIVPPGVEVVDQEVLH